MSTTWPARPTTYRGIPMRSRLEARYAAYLDLVANDWEYEPRAYASPAGQYLPDFYLETDAGPLFIEVRPHLDGAYRALEQMQIILASVPDAILLVDAPDAGIAFASRPRDRVWRRVEAATRGRGWI